MVVGTLADVIEDQFRKIFDTLGLGPVYFFPPRRATNLPPVGKQTHLLLAQPFLSETARALIQRGGTLLEAPYPIGVEGTTAWLESAAKAWNINNEHFQKTIAPAKERAQIGLERYRQSLAGKSLFLFPDSQLEIPLARFLSRECGMELVEVGTPYIDRMLMQNEISLLPSDVLLSEGQDVERQLDRARLAKPDMTVCGLGLANPLEAEGMTTKWSIELVFSPIQGYDQTADLAELFARPLERKKRLSV